MRYFIKAMNEGSSLVEVWTCDVKMKWKDEVEECHLWSENIVASLGYRLIPLYLHGTK